MPAVMTVGTGFQNLIKHCYLKVCHEFIELARYF